MTKFPLVTIITPAYNRADLIVETIESVLNQDYPNLEYIVLDDGSADGTLDVIKRYDGRLRWVSHPNIGETRTVNKGFEMAQGEIIGVVNSDDPLLPGAVTKLVAALVDHPEVVVVYPDWQMIDQHGKVIQTILSYDFLSYAEMVRLDFCLPGPGAFFRRSVLEAIGGRNPDYQLIGDHDFWYRAGLLGPFLRVKGPLATFRVHPGSATMNQRGRRMAEEHLRMMEKLLKRQDIPEALVRLKDEALSSAYFVAGTSLNRSDLLLKLRYFWTALCLSPRPYFTSECRRLLMMLILIIGIPGNKAYNALIRFRKIFGRE